MPDPSPETAALRAALDAAQGRLATEQNRRLAAETRLRTETGNRFTAQEAALDASLSQAEETDRRLQERLVALQEEGKFAEAAAVTSEIGANQAKLAQFRGQKEWLGQQKQAATSQADPLDRYNESEREWIAKNPRYLEDPAFARRVQAAATYAMEFEGKAKDSPEYWESVNRRVYPERYQGSGEGDAPSGDAGEGDAPAGDTGDFEQQHTRNSPIAPPQVDAPVMQIDAEPPATQQRAAGPGRMNAVAAPPSRRIAEVSDRLRRGQVITATPKEYEMARALYDSIEPNATDRSDDTVIRWYHALYNDPTHQLKRRRVWVNA